MGNNYSNINHSNISSYNHQLSTLKTPEQKERDRSSILRISPSFNNEYSMITVPETLKYEIYKDISNSNSVLISNESKKSNESIVSESDNNLLNILVSEEHCINLSPRVTAYPNIEKEKEKEDINLQQSVLIHNSFNNHEIVNDWYKTNKLKIDSITLSIQKDTMTPNEFNKLMNSTIKEEETINNNEENFKIEENDKKDKNDYVDEFDIDYASFEESISITTIKPQTLKLFKQNGIANLHIKEKIQKPPNYLLIDWLIENTKYFYDETKSIYKLLTEYCTDQCCVTMNAGPAFEYLWIPSRGKKPIRISAPQYIRHSFEEIDNIFPTLGKTNTEIDEVTGITRFDSITLRTIYKRLFRIYAHLFYCHYDIIKQLHINRRIGLVFKHLIFYITCYNIFGGIKSRIAEFEPMERVINFWSEYSSL